MLDGYDLATKTVTLVDDELAMRDVLVRAVRLWHYDCQAANSAEQALDLLEQRLTPVVVTDLRMPGRGGVWLVREIRRRWPQISIIVLTAGHEADAVNECLLAGAHHYFIKPVELDELHHALETTRRAYLHRRDEDRRRLRLERAVRRQTRRVHRTFLSGIESLVRSIEERDPYTAGHSLRVRRYCLRLGAMLDLDHQQMRQLSLAAKLHDIGKVGVPDAILNKAGPLTLAEDLIVREHPVIGERILAPIIRNRAVLEAVRSHHERIDGGGYPDGLKGSAIPLLARIISIADCFDALTSARAYRHPLSALQAIEMLQIGAGTQFQPEFVRAFVETAGRLPVAGEAG